MNCIGRKEVVYTERDRVMGDLKPKGRFTCLMKGIGNSFRLIQPKLVSNE